MNQTTMHSEINSAQEQGKEEKINFLLGSF